MRIEWDDDLMTEVISWQRSIRVMAEKREGDGRGREGTQKDTVGGGGDRIVMQRKVMVRHWWQRKSITRGCLQRRCSVRMVMARRMVVMSEEGDGSVD